MSEDEKPSPAASSPSLARKILAWSGLIIFLGALFFVFVYIYGDPRPAYVASTTDAGEPVSIPFVKPGNTYYRIRANYVALTEPVALRDPIGDLWTSFFSDAVRRAGAASVRLLVSHSAGSSLPRDEEAYFLFDTLGLKAPVSKVTPFLVRQPGAKVELRLDASPMEKTPSGMLPKLLRAAGSYRSVPSKWVSVFPHPTNRVEQELGARGAVLTVRDYSGQAIGSLRISLETRDSMFFPAFLAAGGAKQLNEAGASFDARRDIALQLVGGVTDLNSDLKNEIVATLMNAMPAKDPLDGYANCRRLYEGMSQISGLSKNDAAGLAFLLSYQSGTAIDDKTTICGDVAITSALQALGIIDALKWLQPDKPLTTKKEGIVPSIPDKEKQAKGVERYICLGLSGPRIARHCDALNDIAREWRSGTKFLNMIASRRHIAPHVGLEEPTPEMRYATRRFSDRRQLLIHIALARVENFACFRLIRQKPTYFMALVVIRDSGSRFKRRLDVFEFAFENDGRIGRIRRRPAMQSDIDEAMRLPETSRCRREFISGSGDQMRRLIRDYWRLGSANR